MAPPITWILVTVKGRPELTQRCVEALLSRTEGDRRLFVVDNGSRDATLDFIYRRFREGDVHRLLCNKVGTITQWEKSYAICQAVHALRMEHYDYFAWVDNDMEMKAGWLKVARDVLRARADVAVCSMHNDGTQEKHHPTQEIATVAGHTVRIKETANGAAWVVRREFFDMYGLPPTGMGITREGTEDWHYGRMMRERGIPFAVVEGYGRHMGYGESIKGLAIKEAGG